MCGMWYYTLKIVRAVPENINIQENNPDNYLCRFYDVKLTFQIVIYKSK